MQNPGGSYGGPYGGPYPGGYPRAPPPRRRPWIFILVGSMIVIVAIVLLLVALYPASFGYSPSRPFGIGGFGPFGTFFLFLFVIFIVSWIVRIAWWSSRSPYRGYNRAGRMGRRDGAFTIARERYARGEITREQYDQIVQDL
jgi:uncharacterized membrane protein